MPEGNDYHALQREQNERIKSLETKVEDLEEAVSYTHLTLPTIYSV